MATYHYCGVPPSPLPSNGMSVSPKRWLHSSPGILFMRDTTIPSTNAYSSAAFLLRCLPSRGPAAILAPDEFANEDSCFESLPIGRRTLVTLFIPAAAAGGARWLWLGRSVVCGLWSCWGSAVSIYLASILIGSVTVWQRTVQCLVLAAEPHQSSIGFWHLARSDQYSRSPGSWRLEA
ncbi:unnamed protein product [Ectocarpus sp. 13 AM-2016]